MDNTSALISVIVPCYNYGTFLEQCLSSILAQTYQNWECILVDDGSTDNTPQVAKQLAQKDARIRYIYYPVNAGPAAARNRGLKQAKGSYIQFLDADDLIEPEKLEKQLQVLSHNENCDIVYSNVQYFAGEDPLKLYNSMDLDASPSWMLPLSGSGDTVVLPLLKGNIMVINSPLVRRSLFDKHGYFDETLAYNEDWELWLRFALNKASFCFDNNAKTRALVRVHKSSYSTDMFKMYVFGLKATLKAKRFINTKKYNRILMPKIAYHKKVIDKELINSLAHNKEEAIKKTEFVYTQTGDMRYSLFIKLFARYPLWICKLYTEGLFLINKVKTTIRYA